MTDTKLAIFFPGLGYHTDKPLLYYSRKLCMQLGYENCINLKFEYDGQKIFKDKSRIPEAIDDLLLQTEEQLNKIDFAKYKEIIFVSKSVGTAVATRFAKENNLECKNIYLTPLEQTFIEGMNNGIAFTGTLDPWVKTEIIKEEALKQKITLTIYNEANHSLETNDVKNNIEILKDVMDRIENYLR